MAKKRKGNFLESVLRYEIILALFTLIGVYYFLSFSPIRMPRHTISSATHQLQLEPATPTPGNTTSTDLPTTATNSTPPTDDGLEQPETAAADLPDVPPLPAGQVAASTMLSPPPAAGKDQLPPAENSGSTPTATTPPPAEIVAEKLPPAVAAKPTTPRQPPAVVPTDSKLLPTLTTSYVIQAGIFIFQDSLDHCRQILDSHGYTTFVTTGKKAVPMHRVFLGPFTDREKARKMASLVKQWGDNPFISQRGKALYVNIGSFYYRSAADARIAQYHDRGLTPQVFREPVPIPHHTLLVNGFRFGHFPHDTLQAIRQLGIPDAFVRNWQP
ncbi:MAG: SPOR domain-containing protein [Deltaproteobacteria bacterium]|nr:SPOR domain-containing protein [Candidatus Anaeroferrophillus wilburensis]MBN2888136.1 SPOR domain-containing protein [Deltaproteobacteria bacterium]